MRQWLQSNDPRLAAWAAYAIIEQKRDALLPDLAGIIGRWEYTQTQHSWDSDHIDALLAVLDAVIQMNRTLPASTINIAMDVDGYGALKVPLVLLLLRLPATKADPVWKKIFFTGDIRGLSQRLAADILSQNPPPGFAARLMNGLTITAEVTVIDPGVQLGRGLYGSGPSCPSVLDTKNRGWPVIGVYAMLDAPTGKEPELHLGGSDHIYAARYVIAADESTRICWGQHNLWMADGLTAERRVRLIGNLLRESASDMLFDLKPNLSLEFYSTVSYRNQMDGFVSKQLALSDLTAKKLTESGLMTGDEARISTPHLQLRVLDCRKTRKPPLPNLRYGPTVTFWNAN